MLKLLCVLLCWCMTQQAFAQKTDEILVLAEFASDAHSLKSLIEKHYSAGPVTVAGILPNDLTRYQAVYLHRRNGTSITQVDQQTLTTYLQQEGKVFIIGGLSRTTEPGDSADPLWNRVQDTVMRIMAVYSPSSGTVGVLGTYTEGFSRSNPAYNGFDMDLVGMVRAEGLKPVLIESADLSGGSEAAHVSVDTSLRFVLLSHFDTYFSDDFIALTLCSYFQLCTLGVDRDSASAQQITFAPISRRLHLRGKGSIEIFDLLGRVVIGRTEVEDRFYLPEHLPAGSYIVKWQSEDQQAASTILIH